MDRFPPTVSVLHLYHPNAGFLFPSLVSQSACNFLQAAPFSVFIMANEVLLVMFNMAYVLAFR